jgi:hypothetical protein
MPDGKRAHPARASTEFGQRILVQLQGAAATADLIRWAIGKSPLLDAARFIHAAVEMLVLGRHGKQRDFFLSRKLSDNSLQ